MTKQEALAILSSDENNWEEVVSQKLFEVKNYVLRAVLIPKVLRKKAREVARVLEAERALNGGRALNNNEIADVSLQLKSNKVGDVIELYRAYEEKLMRLKLVLTQSFYPEELIFVLENMARLEDNRQKELLPLATEFVQGNQLQVKISEDSHTGEILSELKRLEKTKRLEKKDVLSLSYFEKDLVRIKKYNTKLFKVEKK